MARILLVRPEESRSKYDFQGVIENECLDLEWICKILSDQGHEVTIFDKQVESASFTSFIADKQFEVFYGESRCFQEPFILEYAKAFKDKYNGLVILGGIHAQICRQRLFQDYVDLILSGYNYYSRIQLKLSISMICPGRIVPVSMHILSAISISNSNMRCGSAAAFPVLTAAVSVSATV